MKKVLIVYGSTTGNCETMANMIHEAIAHESELVEVSALNLEEIKGADLVLLGSSTWGYGELQDDWSNRIDDLTADVLSDKAVAVFGCGDEDGFGEVFCEATAILQEKAQDCGGRIVADRLTVDGDPRDSQEAIQAFAKQF